MMSDEADRILKEIERLRRDVHELYVAVAGDLSHSGLNARVSGLEERINEIDHARNSIAAKLWDLAKVVIGAAAGVAATMAAK